MTRSKRTVTWVVYRMVVHKQQAPQNAVCEQSEWDAMERAQPGLRTLIRDGIANEGEAERLARGTSGDTKPRVPRPATVMAALGQTPLPSGAAATVASAGG